MNTRSWQLVLLGKPYLRAPDGRPLRCTGKPLAFLTVLSLEGRTSRSALAELLWPGVAESTARNNLVIFLRRLRQQFGADLWIAGDRIELLPEVEVDVQTLLSATAVWPGRPASGRGTLLEDTEWPDLPEFSAWLQGWRERLDALRTRKALDDSLRLEHLKQYPAALEAAQQALGWNPVSEEAHRAVMRLHYLGGQLTAAQTAFEHCRAVLREQLNTEPMAQTLELAARIRQEARRPLPVSTAASAPLHSALVGREQPWAEMQRAWDAGQTIILVGEAGAGKSRLAAEFVATKGAAMLFEGRPGDMTVPFAAAVRQLRRLLRERKQDAAALPPALRAHLARLLPELTPEDPAEVARPPSPTQDKAQLHQAIQTLLTLGMAGKVAIIADDIQYSDDASTEIWMELVAASGSGGAGERPHMVICYRHAELAPAHEAALAQLLATGRAVQIPVRPLTEAQVQALLEDLSFPVSPSLTRSVMQLSGGNPLYVLEAARYLLEAPDEPAGTLHPRLEQLISQRLRRLPAETLPVARAASVLQRDFTAEQVAGMLELPLLEAAATWEVLEHAGILHGDRFSHDLVAEVILRQIPEVVRRLLHRAAARTLAVSGDPARVARQWLDGGEPLQAAPWLLRAATAAQRLFRHREAVGFAAQAAQLLEHAGQSGPAYEAWIQRAHLLADLEDQDAEQTLAVQDLHRTAVTAAQQAQAYLLEARLYFKTGDAEGMVRASEQGLQLAQSQPNLHLEGELQEVLGIALFVARQPARAGPAWTRLLDLGQTLQDERFVASAHEGLGYLLSFTEPAAAPGHYAQAERAFVAIGDPARAATSAQKASLLSFQRGDIRTATEILLRAQGYVEPLEGHHVTKLLLADGLSRARLAQEDYGPALEVLDRAEQAHGLPGISRSWAVTMHRALILTRLGSSGQARDLLKPLLTQEHFLHNLRPQLYLIWGEVLQALGEAQEALRVCEQAIALLAVQDQAYLRVRLSLLQAQLVPLHQREAVLSPALDLCRQHGFQALEAAVQVRLGAAALQLGRPATDLPAELPDATQVGHEELWLLRLASLRHEQADASLIQGVRAGAEAWLSRVIRRVPDRYRDRFLQSRTQRLQQLLLDLPVEAGP